ncbi:alpha/beta hydrolase [Chryseoglobus sp. 28M-23]|uniref:alpha/beta hydrolase n=1 Tax=Chryseoglobus sp. 28M-23 TaxID=2772253 RepID=UPI001747154E|nr:alpha/beta hydrolase [Chryseoglobus sp. 28M-23]QOD93056.1 alpha/beta hydrolase [Chryseoglobus sp. 28M-23]
MTSEPLRRRRVISPRARRVRAIGVGSLAALLLVVLGFAVWANSPYQAEREATLEVFRNGGIQVAAVDEGILMTPLADSIDLPENPDGLVFIPGARVDAYAYLYQLSGIVEEQGVTVLITEPTLNLAFVDTRELDDLTSAAPHVDRWFVGGHSLGGVRACLMAEGSETEGLVLLGSYCANDLSASGLPVLSIAAENDGLTDLDTITESATLLPGDARFEVIEGANHAAFGDYGPQSGDGERTITSAQMREQLTALLVELLR